VNRTVSTAEANELLRERLFTWSELARAIGVHLDTLKAWSEADPTFPLPIIIKGRPRIRFVDFRAWLDRQPRGGASHAKDE
jgi:hypothetical protein